MDEPEEKTVGEKERADIAPFVSSSEKMAWAPDFVGYFVPDFDRCSLESLDEYLVAVSKYSKTIKKAYIDLMNYHASLNANETPITPAQAHWRAVLAQASHNAIRVFVRWSTGGSEEGVLDLSTYDLVSANPMPEHKGGTGPPEMTEEEKARVQRAKDRQLLLALERSHVEEAVLSLAVKWKSQDEDLMLSGESRIPQTSKEMLALLAENDMPIPAFLMVRSKLNFNNADFVALSRYLFNGRISVISTAKGALLRWLWRSDPAYLEQMVPAFAKNVVDVLDPASSSSFVYGLQLSMFAPFREKMLALVKVEHRAWAEKCLTGWVYSHVARSFFALFATFSMAKERQETLPAWGDFYRRKLRDERKRNIHDFLSALRKQPKHEKEKLNALSGIIGTIYDMCEKMLDFGIAGHDPREISQIIEGTLDALYDQMKALGL